MGGAHLPACRHPSLKLSHVAVADGGIHVCGIRFPGCGSAVASRNGSVGHAAWVIFTTPAIFGRVAAHICHIRMVVGAAERQPYLLLAACCLLLAACCLLPTLRCPTLTELELARLTYWLLTR